MAVLTSGLSRRPRRRVQLRARRRLRLPGAVADAHLSPRAKTSDRPYLPSPSATVLSVAPEAFSAPVGTGTFSTLCSDQPASKNTAATWSTVPRLLWQVSSWRTEHACSSAAGKLHSLIVGLWG